MTRRKINDRAKDPIVADPTAPSADDASAALTSDDASSDDTEGHSIGLLLGMMALDEANRASDREHARTRIAADVPPLTKSWPNLRAEAAAAAAANATVNEADAASNLGTLPLPAPSQS